MIFFDNQTNNTSCVAGMNGPTVVYTPDGVTRALFEVNYCRSIDHIGKREEWPISNDAGRALCFSSARKGRGSNILTVVTTLFGLDSIAFILPVRLLCWLQIILSAPDVMKIVSPRIGMDTFHVIISAALVLLQNGENITQNESEFIKKGHLTKSWLVHPINAGCRSCDATGPPFYENNLFCELNSPIN